jgi:hypothetical protein
LCLSFSSHSQFGQPLILCLLKTWNQLSIIMKHFEVVEHTVSCSHIRHYARATSDSQEAELLMAVKQYKPQYSERSEPLAGDMTIIACPALGFPKELYEPVWDCLFECLRTAGKHFIRNIWVADPATQASSGILNRGKLGSERG